VPLAGINPLAAITQATALMSQVEKNSQQRPDGKYGNHQHHFANLRTSLGNQLQTMTRAMLRCHWASMVSTCGFLLIA